MVGLGVVIAAWCREILGAKWYPLRCSELLRGWKWRNLAMALFGLSTGVAHLLGTSLVHGYLVWGWVLVRSFGLRYLARWVASNTRCRAFDSRLWSFLLQIILVSCSRSPICETTGRVRHPIKRCVAPVFVLLLKPLVLNKRLLRWEALLSFLCHLFVLLGYDTLL